MPVDVAAVTGERWPVAGKKGAKPWHDARSSVTLAAGQQAAVTLHAAFQPERLVVDPDVTVLMLERNKAEVKLAAEGGALAAAK